MLLSAAVAPILIAQEPADAPETPLAPAGPPVTVRGIVLNAATGQPLPRVLVRVTGNEGMGAITNSEGHFEIRGVPSSVQNFSLTKPGFQEQMAVDEGKGFDEGGDFPFHSVRVADGMPELSFSMSPRNAISGHVTLSTGKPALGIGLTLLRQTIVNGRTGWDEVERHQTTPDGAFRYAGLNNGTYLLQSQPEFDNDSPAEPSCNADAPAEMTGYAPLFFNEATELSGAGRITVAGGQNAEINLSLNLAKFHFVQATIAHMPAGAKWTLVYTLFDHSGRQVDYQIHKEKDNSICVYLPDGSYTLAVQASTEEGTSPQAGTSTTREATSRTLAGQLVFTVEGKATRDLRVSLTQSTSTQVNVRYEPALPEPVKENKKDAGDKEGVELDGSPMVLSAMRVDAANQNGTTLAQAIQTGETSYALVTTMPGAYWISAFSKTGICLGEVSAGGQNLAHSPWIAAPSGVGAPIEVVLRTDCASLTVQMPPALAADSYGESAHLYVYAIPEFDSLEDVSRGRLDQFDNRSAKFVDLPPGPYRVFAFRTPRSIEFRNPAAVDQLGPGQEVTLEPHGNVSVLLKEISK